jgi:hypothetical protein
MLLSQVLAAHEALIVLAMPLGAALGGPLTEWLGAQQVLLASAVATIAAGLVATAVIAARRRELARRHEPLARGADESADGSRADRVAGEQAAAHLGNGHPRV